VKLKDLEKRLKSEPNNLGLKVQVAGLMREAGRSLEAVELYRSVALAYRDQGRTQQAIAVCRSILDIAPEDSACQGLLAMLQQQQRASAPVAPVKGPVADHQARSVPVAAVAEHQARSEPARAPAPQQAVMRSSPMPPAPEVPSLRPQTTPPTNRPPTTGPQRPVQRERVGTSPPRMGSRPLTGQHRPITPSHPPPAPSRPATPSQPMPLRGVTTTQAPFPRDAPTPPLREATTTKQPVAPPPMEPIRRSSFESTPLPPAVPYHLADQTSQPTKVSSRDLDDNDTRIDPDPGGLARAAKRISGAITQTHGIPSELDMSAELDTRQRPKIPTDELDKIGKPPPTVQLERIDDIDDLITPPPPDDLITARSSSLTPLPRGSDDALTPPPRPSNSSISSRNLPRIGPPRTSSRPSGVIAIPPKGSKTPSAPPGVISIPPKKTTSSPPLPTPPHGTPLAKLRPAHQPPPPPPARSAMPKIARESEDELTRPRDRGAPERESDTDPKRRR
jgi:hypothetical protein